jgi:hypothetical protein
VTTTARESGRTSPTDVVYRTDQSWLVLITGGSFPST